MTRRYIQPVGMTSFKHKRKLFLKEASTGDLCDILAVISVLIEGVDSYANSGCHGF